MLITLKVNPGSYDRLIAKDKVKRGHLLGFSPYFDDQLVLSPIDGIIERISYDREGQALLISIRQTGRQRRAAQRQGSWPQRSHANQLTNAERGRQWA